MHQFWRSPYPLLWVWFVPLDFDLSLIEICVAEESVAIGLPLASALLLEATVSEFRRLKLCPFLDLSCHVSFLVCEVVYLAKWWQSLAFAISADTYGPADRVVCVCLRFVGDSGMCRKKWVELASLYGVQGSAKSLSVGIASQLLSVTSQCSEL